MTEASKKKTAILFAYNGAQFNGSQIQNDHEGVRTVEAELQNALFKARCIAPENYGFINKIKWSRSSRTDKGVHALCSVIAAKLLWEPRPYEEILAEINSNLPADVKVISLKLVTSAFHAKSSASFREYQYLFPLKPLNCEFSPELVTALNDICKQFHGTHSFHNYSKDVKQNQPEAKRYIIKYDLCSESVEFEGFSYLKFIITGQSFLYHQIRKIIAMTILVFKKKFLIEDIQKSFDDSDFFVPLAPAEGLSLHRVHFSMYNKKQKHRPVNLNANEEAIIEDFYNSSILPTIHSALNIFQEWTDTELINK